MDLKEIQTIQQIQFITKFMKDLIQQYVNLYRILWNGNTGLWTGYLERMSERELKKEIREMKQAIREKNSYYPGLAH